MAPAELRRFSERFKPLALVDEHSRAYHDSGLAYLRLDAAEMYERLLANQLLLKLPLVRAGRDLSVGLDEPTWRRWLGA
jgi:arsenate reductase-like glutaredoxin family protein